MSAETEEAIRVALQAHVADVSDHYLLTDWYIVSASVGPESGSEHLVHTCSDMPLHTAYGLLTVGLRRLQGEIDN